MTQKIYLDYNATTPLRPEVLALVTEIISGVGNASSVHGFGRTARKYVEDAREQVATLCGAKPEQVIFTSGATEAINTVLYGFKNKPILISAIEHPAVMEAADHATCTLVLPNGLVDMDAYKELLITKKPAIVSIMLVNSETGVIQPIAEMAKLAHEHDSLFHTDAVQGAGRLDITLDALGVDFITLSAHKFAGPQGVGAIIKRDGLDLEKFMRGGGQEKNCRAGTHNTAGIAGMGLAAELATKHMSDYQVATKLRDKIEDFIIQNTNQATIYGANAPRVGNTCNVGLRGMPAQTQLMALDLDGISVSSGSACSSGAFKPSHVLKAMGVNDEDAKSALRISLGWATTEAEIDAFLESYKKIIDRVNNA